MQINRVIALRCGVAAWTAVFAVCVLANERPTKEYQDLMRASAAIVDLTGATSFGKETDIDASSGASLVEHIKAKDYDGIAADAVAMKAIFEKVQNFWVEKKIEDATELSKAALKGATDLEAAAKAKDNAGVTAAHFAIANACRSCHLAHRVVMLMDRSFTIR
jgi:cytochrome c556